MNLTVSPTAALMDAGVKTLWPPVPTWTLCVAAYAAEMQAVAAMKDLVKSMAVE